MVDQIRSSIGMNEFEIVLRGYSTFPIISVTASGSGNYEWGEGLTQIAHGLGYTPTLMLNVQAANGTKTNNYPGSHQFSSVSGTSGYWAQFGAYVDSTYLYLITDLMLTNTSLTLGSGWKAQWYLLKEKAKRRV